MKKYRHHVAFGPEKKEALTLNGEVVSGDLMDHTIKYVLQETATGQSLYDIIPSFSDILPSRGEVFDELRSTKAQWGAFEKAKETRIYADVEKLNQLKNKAIDDPSDDIKKSMELLEKSITRNKKDIISSKSMNFFFYALTTKMFESIEQQGMNEFERRQRDFEKTGVMKNTRQDGIDVKNHKTERGIIETEATTLDKEGQLIIKPEAYNRIELNKEGKWEEVKKS